MREGEFSNSVSTISTIDGSFSSLLAPGGQHGNCEVHKMFLNKKPTQLLTIFG